MGKDMRLYHLEMADGISLMAIKTLKILAPMMRRKIMPVSCAVSARALSISFHVNVLLAKPNTNAPKAPTAPASLGVKKPP